jgi:hypothetical protein
MKETNGNSRFLKERKKRSMKILPNFLTLPRCRQEPKDKEWRDRPHVKLKTTGT